MARLRLNKSELRRLDQELITYRRYLPALELRRQQLMGMRAQLAEERRHLDREEQQLQSTIRHQLPMLAESKIQLQRLVEVRKVDIQWESVAGVELPTLRGVRFDRMSYDLFASPVWLESALELAERYAEWVVRDHLFEQRRYYLERAIAKTTQRVNLFEQVLIPNAERDRRKIQLFLSDEATNAVVRAKISKRKVQAGAEQSAGETSR